MEPCEERHISKMKSGMKPFRFLEVFKEAWTAGLKENPT